MKNEILKICQKHGYKTPTNRVGITLELLIDGYLNGNVNSFVREKLGCSKDSVTRAIKNAFPDKPTNNASTTQWLLRKENKKWCSKCSNIYDLANFYTNTSNHDGLADHCKQCSKLLRVLSYEKDPTKELEANAIRRRLRNSKQTPSWANKEKILEIYKNRPEGMHVDHIIPLNGKYVSGLHVENNLQYLPAAENLAKHNKFGSVD